MDHALCVHRCMHKGHCTLLEKGAKMNNGRICCFSFLLCERGIEIKWKKHIKKLKLTCFMAPSGIN